MVANSGTDNVGIFLNYHNGTFAPQTTYSTGMGSRPYSVGVADFNNDTHIDIVVAFFGINSIGVLLGDGNGHFGKPIVTSLGSSRPLSLSVGDMNDDDAFDIVVANYGTSTITLLLGVGDGSFRIDSVWEMGFDSMPYFVTVADLNNDHRLDVIAVNNGTNELVVLLNDKNGSYTLHKYYTGLGSHPSSAAIGYFDVDKTLDIAVAYSGASSIGIFFGHGNGTLTNHTTYSMAIDAQPEFIVVGDFNDDVYVDIVVADSEYDQIVVFKGYGNGSFTVVTRHSTGYKSDPSAMIAGHFDNDYKLDVTIVNSATNNLLLLTSYAFYPVTSYTEYSIGDGDYRYNIDVADFNEDNYLDIVVCNEGINDIGVFINLGNGTFGDRQVYKMGDISGVPAAIAADVNNDHHMDVVAVLDENYGVNVLLGYGNGTLAHASTIIAADDIFVYRIALGDIDHDGNLDIVITDFYNEKIVLHFGLGDGTFTNPTVLFDEPNIEPAFVDVNDVNNDSFSDIIIGNHGDDGGILIFLGHGDGSFNTPLFTSTDGDIPNSFTLGDLNGDRKLDIVYTSTSPSYIGILVGRGDGTYETATKYFCVRGSKPWKVSLGYYDDDAFIDIVVGITYDESINIYLGMGNGSFRPPIRISTGANSKPWTSRFADFDNDDQQEIAVANAKTNKLQIFSVHYDADFSSETSYTTGSNSRPLSIHTGDLDDDGKLDIVVANSGTDDVEILFSYDNGIFGNRTSISTGLGSHPQSIAIADFDRNRFLDITVANAWHDNMIVFLRLSDESFPARITYSTGIDSAPSSIVAGDLNNDGRVDVVVANKGTNDLAVFLAFDYVSFTTHIIDVPGVIPAPYFVSTADFNNDHLVDIAVVNSWSETLGIFLGYGNGTFSDQITYSTGSSSKPISLAVGDFNNDNYLDLVVANSNGGTISVFLGYGNGSFQAPRAYSTGNSTKPYSVAVADFNRDRQLDIVVSVAGEVSQHHIWVFFGTGNGSFRGKKVYSMSNQSKPIWVAVDDLNKDAIPDIVVANYLAGNICILFGHGNGSFGRVLKLSTGEDSRPLSVALGDINRDSNIDIVVADYYSSSIFLFFGNGNGSFSSPKISSADSNSDLQAVILSDINNDTVLDILLCDYNVLNSSIGILYGFGDGNFTLPKIYPTGLNSWPYMIATGDFNDDGRVDLAINYLNQDRIGVFIQAGNEPFGSSSLLSTDDQSQPESIVLGNFNNDHRLDIAVANTANGNIGIFIGHGNGEFADQVTYFIGDNSLPSAIAVSHFNNDDHLDIAVVSTASDAVVILFGDGNGRFGKMTTYSTGIRSMPVAIVARDLNKDEHSDVVVANRGSNEVLIFLGTNNGLFEEARRYSIGYDTRPQSVAVGDINGDDMLDIVVANYGSGHIEVLLQTC